MVKVRSDRGADPRHRIVSHTRFGKWAKEKATGDPRNDGINNTEGHQFVGLIL